MYGKQTLCRDAVRCFAQIPILSIYIHLCYDIKFYFLQTLANFFKYSGRIPQEAIELMHELANADIILELSVYDVLWGYEDAYLKLFQDLLGVGTIPSTNFGIFLGVSHWLHLFVLPPKNVNRKDNILESVSYTFTLFGFNFTKRYIIR